VGILDALQFLDHDIFRLVDQFLHGESPLQRCTDVGRFSVRG
jgi:hypothetical protein